MKFKFLEHRADAKFQAYGKDLEEAFGNAALALSTLMIKGVRAKQERRINIEADNLNALLYIFLEELLFLVDTEEFFVKQVKSLQIEKGDKSYFLNAVVAGDKYREQHELLSAVKAVTYSEMKIKQEKNKFMVQVVVDL